MPTPQEALAAFMKSPGIKNSTANLTTPEGLDPAGASYLARRTADIYSGVDDMVPDADSVEVRAAQHQFGGSRANIREAGLAKVRGLLKMQGMEDQQAQQMAHIKGQYDAEAQGAQAEAALNRVLAQQQGQDARTQAQIAGALERTGMTTGTQREIAGGRQQTAQQRLNTQGVRAINAQIAKMEAEAQKNRPNALVRMWSGDPRADAVNAAKQARDAALEIAREMPDADPEEALMLLGYNDATPEDVAQVRAFLAMIRGL